MSLNVNLSPEVVKGLLPKAELFPTRNIWDVPSIKPKNSIFSPLVNNLLPTINEIQMNWINLKMSMIEGEVSEKDYSSYLQFPNAEIKALVNTIVEPGDTNDEKAYKILMWVQENIEYKSDFETYGTDEYWAKPTLTLKKGCGDCEDGAFLIHSLMLNAGIPYEQIRTYGGLVFAGEGAATGGHGWTSYKRETDNERVVLDWCYYANKDPIAERTPMKDDIQYIDDWFYVDARKTVDTPLVNKVKDPGAMGYNAVPRRLFVLGQRVDTKV
jgi:hypothetical protein